MGSSASEGTAGSAARARSVRHTTPLDDAASPDPVAVREGRRGSNADEASARAHRFIDALRALETTGDVDALVPLFAEDAEVSNPNDATPRAGRDGARTFWRAYRDSFARVESRFRNVVEAGGVALLEWRSEGETASGHRVAYDGVSVLEFGQAGEITRFRAYFDPTKLTERAD